MTKKYALLCLHNPVKLCLFFGHSAAPNPQNYTRQYVTRLVLYRRQGLASVGMGVVGIVAEVQR